ncbi:glycosyltransferase family 4 protein [Natronobacterium gregoryi]|uniref:Glycosyl transferase family 1 n=2 Tax=Natronobacterium gregoryi TaxID=44930 RepID=L0ALU0_NATGS|nr:glycosyltransferase [Natronobacterium gregoryi]AFZ74761.1 glycosyltransferase [Natronobacterium gregoryi SP2]ELY73568.1 group 1 glycosyl transferase [Natronobacterium gregoryi SP2]PLK19404.1 glycosyl transferase family 1 [Natronobacterium gregoryi SP2]SFJ49706.1 Glycosyltransferase involved in cell wall bisynthesis [Natronobacterium gregoryi]
MRVAFVSFETIHHRDTETKRRLQTILTLLQNAGHDVHVYCARFWEGDCSTFERNGITYHGLGSDLEARYAFVARLPVALASLRPDVVHTIPEPPGQVLAANWGATLARAPLVLEWCGTEELPANRVMRWALPKPDCIITPSELVTTWVMERGVDEHGVDVVPNPIDVDRIRETPVGEDVDVIYSRRLDEGANLESLFLALAEYRDRDWTATVLGDGPERDTYERLASDLRIENRVTFAGNCSLEERIAAYRGAHVFAQTAEYCVFPSEMLWAIASGCVGIVEYHVNSSAHELVEGWDRGFRTTSEEELADAIVEAGDLERREFDEAFDEYDKDAVLEQYLTTYERLQESSGVL